jgi:hypothetical protein
MIRHETGLGAETPIKTDNRERSTLTKEVKEL